MDYFYGENGYLAVFLTSEEAKDKYPKQYEKLVAAVNKSNFYRRQNGYELYLFYDWFRLQTLCENWLQKVELLLKNYAIVTIIDEFLTICSTTTVEIDNK